MAKSKKVVSVDTATEKKKRNDRLNTNFWGTVVSANKVKRLLEQFGVDPEEFRTLYLATTGKSRPITDTDRDVIRRFNLNEISIEVAMKETGYATAKSFLNLRERVLTTQSS